MAQTPGVRQGCVVWHTGGFTDERPSRIKALTWQPMEFMWTLVFPQIISTSLAVGAELLTALYNHSQYLGELRGAESSRQR